LIDTGQAFWLALIQGLTEFLPISSSGHLVLVPRLLGWPDQDLTFDVAVHIGTLFAVVIYFRRDIATILWGLVDELLGRGQSKESRLGGLILLATLPAVVAGVFVNEILEASLRQPLVIAATTVGFAVLLLVADNRGSRQRRMDSLGWRDALIIGVAQALALVPGTSRAGITITAALMIGLERRSAARFSFLLAIPVILAAASLKGCDLVYATDPVDWGVFALGICVAAGSSWLVIALFLRFIERIGMLPFVLYRLVLGGLLFLWFR
jgi:undecaprenyl-diphosphatase